MSIPQTVSKLLEDLGINFQVEPTPDLAQATSPKTQRALRRIFRTESETLQVLLSDQAILDIDALSRDKSNPWCCASETFVNDLLLAHGYDELPAVPQLNTFKTLVDRNLLEAEQVLLASGFDSQCLVLESGEFARLVHGFEVTNEATHISEVPARLDDDSQDAEEINSAVRNYTAHRIQKTLTETLEIPPLSDTTRRILALSAKSDADAAELVEIVEVDPSLSAQVVGWAASPYYSAPGTIKSIHDATVRVLGFDLVMNLALGLSLGDTLKVPKDDSASVTPYWRQSVYCALAMEKLNQCLPAGNRGIPGMAYLTGLLNNFGYLIMAHVFSSHFTAVNRYQEVNEHLDHMTIEHFLLGISREQMCSQLMLAWNLPETVAQALRFQQSPGYEGEGAIYANLCFVATRLLAANGIGNSVRTPVPAELYEHLGLNQSDAEEIIGGLLEISDEIDQIVSMFPD